MKSQFYIGISSLADGYILFLHVAVSQFYFGLQGLWILDIFIQNFSTMQIPFSLSKYEISLNMIILIGLYQLEWVFLEVRAAVTISINFGLNVYLFTIYFSDPQGNVFYILQGTVKINFLAKQFLGDLFFINLHIFQKFVQVFCNL